jgi:hypothetical protein
MATPVGFLIAESYYLSSVRSRELDQPSGADASDGLTLLNDIFAEKAYKWTETPYRTETIVDCVINQNVYPVAGFTEVESITYLLGNIRIPLRLVTYDYFFNTYRIQSVQSLPDIYYVEKTPSGINVNIYYPPNLGYQMLIRGRANITQVGLYDDLDVIFDKAFQSYLKYELALRIAQHNNSPLPANVMPTLEDLRTMIRDRNPMDTTPTRTLCLTKNYGFNLAVANISKGWVPA